MSDPTDPTDPVDRPQRMWGAPTLPARQVLHQLEQRFRLDFRRAIVAGTLAVACLVVGVDLGGVKRHGDVRWLIIGLTVGFVAFAVLAIRSTARQLNRLATHKAGVPTASALRTICLMIGAVFVLLGVVQLLAVNLHDILLGGAITGVIVGIAAQQPLGNFFAGLVMLFARPYVPGERVRIHSGAMGGPFDGRIIYAGLMYTVIETDEGCVNVPNLGLMTSAIGPAVDTAAEGAPATDDAAEAVEGATIPTPPMPTPPVSPMPSPEG